MIANVMLVCMLFATTLIAAGCGKTQDMEAQGWEVQQIKACEGSDKHDCVDLVVELDSDLYAQGAPITVTATILVLDDGEVTITFGNPLRDFEFVFDNDRNENVSLTEEGIRIRYARFARIQDTFDRDTQWQRSFRIDEWFELSEPDTYTLTLKREVWTDEAVEVIGNPVTFTRLP